MILYSCVLKFERFYHHLSHVSVYCYYLFGDFVLCAPIVLVFVLNFLLLVEVRCHLFALGESQLELVYNLMSALSYSIGRAGMLANCIGSQLASGVL